MELKETGAFSLMDLRSEEAEHSIEMQLPYIAKIMEKCIFLARNCAYFQISETSRTG